MENCHSEKTADVEQTVFLSIMEAINTANTFAEIALSMQRLHEIEDVDEFRKLSAAAVDRTYYIKLNVGTAPRYLLESEHPTQITRWDVESSRLPFVLWDRCVFPNLTLKDMFAVRRVCKELAVVAERPLHIPRLYQNHCVEYVIWYLFDILDDVMEVRNATKIKTFSDLAIGVTGSRKSPISCRWDLYPNFPVCGELSRESHGKCENENNTLCKTSCKYYEQFVDYSEFDFVPLEVRLRNRWWEPRLIKYMADGGNCLIAVGECRCHENWSPHQPHADIIGIYLNPDPANQFVILPDTGDCLHDFTYKAKLISKASIRMLSKYARTSMERTRLNRIEQMPWLPED
jgi:hypothetical protein